MRFTDRVLALHPAIITITFVVMFAGGGVAMNAYPFGSSEASVVFALTMPLLIAPLLLWHYSLYRAASDRGADSVGHSGRRAFLFALACAGLGVFLVAVPMLAYADDASYQKYLSVLVASMAVGNFSYFASIWAAANALTRFEERAKITDLPKTIGTFLLEFYLPFGIWVIYPRIKRLLAAPVSP